MTALRILATIIAGFAGLILGYLAGVLVACEWLWPASNACGFPAVFLAAPLGAVVGAVIGSRLARRYIKAGG